MRPICIAASVLFAALIGLAAGGQSSFVVQGDYKIGGYLVKDDGTLAGAVTEFGTPTTRQYQWSGVGCRVAWRRISLTILFYNLGGGDPCQPAAGRFRTATLTGRHWRTSKGLRNGDGVTRLRRLYPRATFHANDGSWWLVTRFSRIGDNGYYPGLRARVRSGRVSALVIEYAAGGD